MCVTCGCGGKKATVEDLDQTKEHVHSHPHDEDGHHHHDSEHHHHHHDAGHHEHGDAGSHRHDK